MNEAEVNFVNAFVLPEKQERWLALLASESGRRKITSRLAHNPDLDPRNAAAIPPSAGPRELAALLRERGSGETVHLISESTALDGTTLPLEAALDRCAFGDLGTILICAPRKLALYIAESSRESRILERKSV